MSKIVFQFIKNKYKFFYNILKNGFTKFILKKKIHPFKIKINAPIVIDELDQFFRTKKGFTKKCVSLENMDTFSTNHLDNNNGDKDDEYR
jgi:hypothetical protein